MIFTAAASGMTQQLASLPASQGPDFIPFFALLSAIDSANVPTSLRLRTRIGHGAVRALTDDNESSTLSPYAAIRSAAAAAAAITREKEEFSFRFGGSFAVIDIVIPLIVVEAPLFEFYLDGTGQELLTPVDQIEILTHSPSARGGSVIVRVLGAAIVANWARVAAADALHTIGQTVPHARRLRDDLHKMADALGLTSGP